MIVKYCLFNRNLNDRKRRNVSYVWISMISVIMTSKSEQWLSDYDVNIDE